MKYISIYQKKNNNKRKEKVNRIDVKTSNNFI